MELVFLELVWIIESETKKKGLRGGNKLTYNKLLYKIQCSQKLAWLWN